MMEKPLVSCEVCGLLLQSMMSERCERRGMDRLWDVGNVPPVGLFLFMGIGIAARAAWAFVYRDVVQSLRTERTSVQSGK